MAATAGSSVAATVHSATPRSQAAATDPRGAAALSTSASASRHSTASRTEVRSAGAKQGTITVLIATGR
jgi:hypothetical protein